MRILLATDFSAPAQTAHELVQGLSLPSGSEIRLVHAIEPLPTVAVFASASMLAISDAVEAEARAELGASAAALAAPGVDIKAVLGAGRAADVIVDECFSFDPDLVVVGSRGRGGLATSVLGSVSAEVVDRAPCPVLVARGRSLARIVLAEDGSAPAVAAARVIGELPLFGGADIRVVSVVDVPFPILMPDPATAGAAAEAIRAHEGSLVTLRAAHSVFARERAAVLAGRGLRATWEIREGGAVSELLAAAQAHQADCIVTGSRGHSGLRRLFLGSVARGVLLNAPCSVLIAHVPLGQAKVPGTADGVGLHLTESPAR